MADYSGLQEREEQRQEILAEVDNVFGVQQKSQKKKGRIQRADENLPSRLASLVRRGVWSCVFCCPLLLRWWITVVQAVYVF